MQYYIEKLLKRKIQYPFYIKVKDLKENYINLAYFVLLANATAFYEKYRYRSIDYILKNEKEDEEEKIEKKIIKSIREQLKTIPKKARLINLFRLYIRPSEFEKEKTIYVITNKEEDTLKNLLSKEDLSIIYYESPLYLEEKLKSLNQENNKGTVRIDLKIRDLTENKNISFPIYLEISLSNNFDYVFKFMKEEKELIKNIKNLEYGIKDFSRFLAKKILSSYKEYSIEILNLYNIIEPFINKNLTLDRNILYIKNKEISYLLRSLMTLNQEYLIRKIEEKNEEYSLEKVIKSLIINNNLEVFESLKF